MAFPIKVKFFWCLTHSGLGRFYHSDSENFPEYSEGWTCSECGAVVSECGERGGWKRAV